MPASVKRAVWARDDGRCVFVGTDGRCQETAFLELHHVVPFADGGPTNVENLQLRCRAHNAYEARQHLGPMLFRECSIGYDSVRTELGSWHNIGAIPPMGLPWHERIPVDTTVPDLRFVDTQENTPRGPKLSPRRGLGCGSRNPEPGSRTADRGRDSRRSASSRPAPLVSSESVRPFPDRPTTRPRPFSAPLISHR